MASIDVHAGSGDSTAAWRADRIPEEAWLRTQGVGEAVMESTAQCWRPVWYELEPHYRLHLTHPLKTRAPRGRKSDFRDAQRLAERWSTGDLMIPGAEQRSWRWLTRTRVQLRKKLGVTHSHVEGLLEQGGIKLAAVVSNLLGVSGWAMLEYIAQGVTDVNVPAGGSARVLRHKDAQWKEALGGAAGADLPTAAKAAPGSGAVAAAADRGGQ